MTEDDQKFITERINAVSDFEWEHLCAMESATEERWTHAVVLDVPQITEVIVSPIALFVPDDKTEMVPILYGTEERTRNEKGRVFPIEELMDFFSEEFKTRI